MAENPFRFRNAPIDILGIGDADVDIMVSVKNFPLSGQKSSGRIIGKYPGGMVANVLSSAALFGSKCKGILCTGDDEFGRMTLKDLEEKGVDVSSSVSREGTDTYFTTTCIAPDGEKRMILCFSDAIYPEENEVDEESLDEAKIVQLTGSHLPLSIPVARRAKANGAIVSFDLERLQSVMDREKKLGMLSLPDIVFPNEEGLLSFMDEECDKDITMDDAALELIKMGPKVVVVTEGADGATLYTESEKFHVPAFSVTVTDTTGAGDTFIGAFLSSLIRGHSLEECLHLASAASAISITAPGSRTAQPTYKETLTFLDNRGIMIKARS